MGLHTNDSNRQTSIKGENVIEVKQLSDLPATADIPDGSHIVIVNSIINPNQLSIGSKSIA